MAKFQDNGISLYEKGLYIEAMPLLMEEAEGGNVISQRYLGILYLAHIDQPNYSRGMFWLKKAASENDGVAQYELGSCYIGGSAVKEDIPLAVSLFKKAASQNVAASQAALGAFYLNGYGVEKNIMLSRYWTEKAAKNGDINSQYDMGYRYFYGKYGAKNYQLARLWFDQASDSGDERASYLLGLMYRDGVGVEKNCIKAKHYVEKSVHGCGKMAKEFLSDLRCDGS